MTSSAWTCAPCVSASSPSQTLGVGVPRPYTPAKKSSHTDRRAPGRSVHQNRPRERRCSRQMRRSASRQHRPRERKTTQRTQRNKCPTPSCRRSRRPSRRWAWAQARHLPPGDSPRQAARIDPPSTTTTRACRSRRRRNVANITSCAEVVSTPLVDVCVILRHRLLWLHAQIVNLPTACFTSPLLHT